MTPLTVDSLVDYVKKRRHVSYVELRKEFGTGGYCHEVVPNCFDMIGCSKELINTVGEAVRQGKIQEFPTHFLVYFSDGEVPNLPIAKRMTKKGYSKPHWIPVVFDLPKRKKGK